MANRSDRVRQRSMNDASHYELVHLSGRRSAQTIRACGGWPRNKAGYTTASAGSVVVENPCKAGSVHTHRSVRAARRPISRVSPLGRGSAPAFTLIFGVYQVYFPSRLKFSTLLPPPYWPPQPAESCQKPFPTTFTPAPVVAAPVWAAMAVSLALRRPNVSILPTWVLPNVPVPPTCTHSTT